MWKNKETPNQPAQKEEGPGKSLQQSWPEVTLGLNPNRPKGVTQPEKEEKWAFLTKEVTYAMHGSLRKYGTFKDVWVIDCVRCRLEESERSWEVNRSLVTGGLGIKLSCRTYIRNRELLKGMKYEHDGTWIFRKITLVAQRRIFGRKDKRWIELMRRREEIKQNF